MAAVHGGVSEEQPEALMENLVESGSCENQSEAVEFCIRYTLEKKYGVTL